MSILQKLKIKSYSLFSMLLLHERSSLVSQHLGSHGFFNNRLIKSLWESKKYMNQPIHGHTLIKPFRELRQICKTKHASKGEIKNKRQP